MTNLDDPTPGDILAPPGRMDWTENEEVEAQRGLAAIMAFDTERQTSPNNNSVGSGNERGLGTSKASSSDTAASLESSLDASKSFKAQPLANWL
jgi:hypothetical protein